MKLSAREEIDAPAQHVFAAITDFPRIARLAAARGVPLRRIDALAEPGVGMAWAAEATIRGQRREILSDVTDFSHGERIAITSRTGGIEGLTEVEVTLLGAERTRLRITVELRPTSLSGRVLIQPLRLAKGSLQERLRIRVAGFARSLEAQGRDG
jgi:uncharacterized membrane protein